MNDETRDQNHHAVTRRQPEPQGPGSTPSVPIDTTKAIATTRSTTSANRAIHGNLVQNTSNKRSG